MYFKEILKLTDEMKRLEEDFASFARLASAQSYEDVRLFLARLVRKYRQEHPELAERFDECLKTTQTRSGGSSVLRRGSVTPPPAPEVLPMDRDTRLSLIRVFDDVDGLQAPILPDLLDKAVAMIIREHKERDRLLKRGISPTRSAALIGPPGVGKTLTARWIASALGKPLLVLDLTAVMSSYLGKTGNNLRSALDHAKANEAILLLDEIDAIAKRRSDESDVGELKRLVTVMLQEVDDWPDTGLLLAATNHPELVDPALWRRFDAELHFDVPHDEAIRTAIERFLADDQPLFAPVMDLMVSAYKGQSLSDVERNINNLRRQYTLEEGALEDIITLILPREIKQMSRGDRLELALMLAQSTAMTQAKINEVTGVARDTLRKRLKERNSREQ